MGSHPESHRGCYYGCSDCHHHHKLHGPRTDCILNERSENEKKGTDIAAMPVPFTLRRERDGDYYAVSYRLCRSEYYLHI